MRVPIAQKIVITYTMNNNRRRRILLNRRDTKLNLSHSQISSINLNQIRYCRGLKLIDLSGNQLSSLDLSPIAKLPSLLELCLAQNNFKRLDITPLYFTDNLKDVYIGSFVKTFVNPIAAKVRTKCTLLYQKHTADSKTFSELIRKLGLKRVFNSIFNLFRNLRLQHWYIAQKGFLEGLNMEELPGYDGPPIHLLDNVTSKMSFKEAKTAIYNRTIQLLEKQMERTGPTFGLDIDRMSTTPASILVKAIIESRKREVENLVINITKKNADARGIWFTYYGHVVLRELGFSPYRRNNTTLEDVVEALEGAGLKITLREFEKLPEFETPHSKGLAYFLIHSESREWRWRVK